MNKTVRDHVKRYNESKGYGVEDNDIIETITDANVIYSGESDDFRWWTEVFRVCEIDGMLIGYWWAETTGDESAREKGWEFDPSSICQVEAVQETTTIYKVMPAKPNPELMEK